MITHSLSVQFFDTNAKVGRNEGFNLGVGKWAIENTHKNGYKLVKFSNKHTLKIINTFFRKRLERRWTWRSPDGATKNKIDHLLAERMEEIDDVGVISTFQISSDHRPVRCIFKPSEIAVSNMKKGRNQFTKFTNKWIPTYKREEANALLESKLNVTDYQLQKFPEEV